MDIKVVDAANAYASSLKNQGLGGVGKIEAMVPGGSGTGSGSSFSDLLSETIGGISDAVNSSEAVSTQALNREADYVDVVTTVQNAEMVLETVIAVRDKVIGAYQDIIKMPI